MEQKRFIKTNAAGEVISVLTVTDKNLHPGLNGFAIEITDSPHAQTVASDITGFIHENGHLREKTPQEKDATLMNMPHHPKSEDKVKELEQRVKTLEALLLKK